MSSKPPELTRTGQLTEVFGEQTRVLKPFSDLPDSEYRVSQTITGHPPEIQRAFRRVEDDIFTLRGLLRKLEVPLPQGQQGVSADESYEITQTFPPPSGTVEAGHLDYFWSGYVWVPQTNTVTVTPVAFANEVILFQFILPFAFTVTTATVEVTGARTGKTCGVGLYDLTGNIVLQTQFSMTTTGVKQNTFGTPVTLSPGTYYHAQTADDTLGSFRSFIIGGVDQIMNFSEFRWDCTAVNASGGSGVLPNTLGGTAASSTVRDIVSVLYE